MANTLRDFNLFQNTSSVKWLLLLLSILILPRLTFSCPKVCQCKWRNGKRWVTCTDAKFIDIPRGLDPSTQVLNLEHNNLKILFTDAFVDRSLVNLQKVFLSHCKLIKLEKGSLRRLANLIEIDLSFNFFLSVPSEALRDVSGLRELLLKENKLTHLPKDVFNATPDLVLLDVSFNNIENIHRQAFRSLSRLEVLKISGNRISVVHFTALKPLVSLHGFHVHFNPWNCDCVLRLLRERMLKRNIVTSIPPTCSTPERLKGRQWKTLEINDFVCIPKITTLTPNVTLMEGGNVSLSCSANDSEVKVKWQVADFVDAVLEDETDLQNRFVVSEILKWQNDSIRKISNLTIFNVKIQDTGRFICRAENKAGQDEVNLTLIVSEKPVKAPLIEIGTLFVAGAALGSLVFAFVFAVFIVLFVRKKRKQYDRERMKAGQGKKPHVLPKCRKEDENLSSSEAYRNKLYEYKSIPTNEVVEPSENGSKNDEASVSDNILNDLNKPNEEIQVKSITSNIVPEQADDNVSYVEIPKAQLRTPNQDQNPLLRNLAQQCRDEILRRKGMKMSKAGCDDKLKQNQFPDLLDLPTEQRLAGKAISRRSHTSTDVASVESVNSVCYRKAPSLPSSPVHPPMYTESPVYSRQRLLSDAEGSSERQSLTQLPTDEFDLEFHAAQLELFLQEYRHLQEQLFRIKQSQGDTSDGHNESQA